MEKILEVTGLKKYYGEVKAVDGISFYMEKGALFAFLGPNGSGKSTTIDTICTYLKPESGTVKVDGRVLGPENDAIREIIGVVFQEGLLDGLLTVEENLRVRSALYGQKGKKAAAAVKRASSLAGTDDLLKRRYGKLSGGQKRRCDIARALVNTPKILFLDEPTTGLDPQTRKHIWETLRKLRNDAGISVFFTTHYMEEAAAADYVTIIDGGKVIALGTPAALREKFSNDRLTLICKDPVLVTELLKAQNAEFTADGETVILPLKDTLDALPVVNALAEHVKGFEVTAGSMDDAFINITGGGLREQ